MKGKVIFKITISIIVVIALIIASIFAFQFISTNNKIKETERKLSQIDSTELQDKLIKELEKSKFNINTSNLKTKIGSWEEIAKSDEDISNLMAIELFYSTNKKENPYQNSISAYITVDSKGVVALPLFTIEKDNNGKLNKITYSEKVLKESVVYDTIKKVLKDDYNIDMFIDGNSKYNTRFNKIHNHDGGTIYAVQETLIKVLNEMNHTNNSSYPKALEEYSLSEFGLDINY